MRQALRIGRGRGARSAEDFLRDGHACIARSDRRSALAAFEAGLGVHPDTPELLRAAATVYADSGRPTAAVVRFWRLTEVTPADASAWVSLATVLAAAGDEGGLVVAHLALQRARPAGAEPYLAFGHAMAQCGRWPEAELLFRTAHESAPENPAIRRALANALMSLSRPAEAAEHFRALALLPEAGATEWLSYGHALSAAGRGLASARAFKVAIGCEALAAAGRMGIRETAERMEFNALIRDEVDDLRGRAPTPPIMIACVPKAGTMFLAQSLINGLSKRATRMAGGGIFPDVVLTRDSVPLLVERRGVSVNHCSPCRSNLIEIGERLERMVVHTRDPRQGMISWCHFLPDVVRNADPIQALHFGLPEGFAGWPFALRLDWLIDNHMRHWVGWMAGWLAVSREPAFRTRILFTRHEDLVADQDGFFGRLLDFYGIERARFSAPPMPERGKRNYRSGETEEWRRVMTAEQQGRANALIPAELAHAFGWPRS